MKQLSLLLLLLFNLNSTTAQAGSLFVPDGIKKEKSSENSNESNYKFEFSDFMDKDEWKSIPSTEAGSHFLGDSIAKKVSLVQKLYTYQTTFSPGNPAVRTIIQKPLIYNAIAKLDKYFKKSIRQDSCSKQTAIDLMSHALDVAIVVHAQNSEELESVLKDTKEINEMVKVFAGVTLIQR